MNNEKTNTNIHFFHFFIESEKSEMGVRIFNFSLLVKKYLKMKNVFAFFVIHFQSVMKITYMYTDQSVRSSTGTASVERNYVVDD